MNMRRTLIGISLAAVLCTGSMAVYAAAPGCGRTFTDADGDGVCDYAKRSACAYDMNRADGMCKSMGYGGCGAYFIDTDGDGICDNRQDCAAGSAARTGGGHHRVNAGCGANRR